MNRFAGILAGLGVGRGDRVLIYMPMVPEAVFAMLACARIGAVHSVVFGGFASVSLATRIDDAKPKVIVSADAGSRAGKPVPYKHLLDEAIKLAQFPPHKVVLVNRGLAQMPLVAGRDLDYATLRAEHMNDEVPCAWMESSEPSYILYTSGTTGKPKGVQRDTGGYAVALTSSMSQIFCCQPGETFFCTSDIGWVVGHSYIVYGPLLNGCTTLLYEGTPLRPDAGIWWSIVEKYKPVSMFSSPTAVRVLKKQDPALLTKYDLSSLKLLFLAGEPLDEPTARWISEGIGKPIIDNYWQTETGWPILAIPRGVQALPSKFGSPGVPSAGYDVKIFSEVDGSEVGNNEKGVVAIEGPLPPGCMSTVWGDDERFVKTYWKSVPNRLVYSTFDWGIRDDDGYFFILGRTDDVINVAGHRRGRGGRRGRSVEGTGRHGVRGGQGHPSDRHARTEARARGRGDEDGRQPARRGGAAGARALCQRAAQDPLRQAPAALAAGDLRGPRPGRSHHDRRSDRARTDPRSADGLTLGRDRLPAPARAIQARRGRRHAPAWQSDSRPRQPPRTARSRTPRHEHNAFARAVQAPRLSLRAARWRLRPSLGSRPAASARGNARGPAVCRQLSR